MTAPENRSFLRTATHRIWFVGMLVLGFITHRLVFMPLLFALVIGDFFMIGLTNAQQVPGLAPGEGPLYSRSANLPVEFAPQGENGLRCADGEDETLVDFMRDVQTRLGTTITASTQSGGFLAGSTKQKLLISFTGLRRERVVGIIVPPLNYRQDPARYTEYGLPFVATSDDQTFKLDTAVYQGEGAEVLRLSGFWLVRVCTRPNAQN